MRLEEGENWAMRSDGSNELGVRLFRSAITCMLFICYLYARSVVPSCMNLKKIIYLSLSVHLLNESNNSTDLKDLLYE